MIAALYIDPRGPYPKMGGVQPYALGDKPLLPGFGGTDAREYHGALPVVAHPPCGPWGKLSHLYEGAERDCGPRAVEQVREFGGVLEHPADSKLWDQCGLPMPGESGGRMRADGSPDKHGFTIEVTQCEWGHPARKRTWLYLVGVPRSALEAPPFPGREPTHWCAGRRGMARASANVPAGIKVCSAQQRRRTPTLFAEYLVRLAQSARKP